MNEWHIQSRAHACEACGQAFADKQAYHTVLFEASPDLRRSDICEPCWQKQTADSVRGSANFISHWQGVYEAPPPVVDAIQKDTAESLLRKLIELNDPKHMPAGYILAVMLERKRILKVKEQLMRDGKRVFVYEQPKTGDIFTIADPGLHLHQLEEVQRDVAALLEHGLNPPPPVEAPAKAARPWNNNKKLPPDTNRHLVSDLAALQTRLGYSFRDESLLRLALTHPSVAHEQSASVQTNQRLEFLGDAVLQLVLTRVLFEKFPMYGEGPLTKARAKLVNRRTLADHGRGLEIGAHLLLSRGEDMHGGRERPSGLADAYEALLGAMFLDGGFAAAEVFILREFNAAFGELTSIPILENPKGELQELLQSFSPEAPHYGLISVSGPDHDRVFECTVRHAGVELARGQGKSKKAAESEAASAALKFLRQKAAGTDGEIVPPSGSLLQPPLL